VGALSRHRITAPAGAEHSGGWNNHPPINQQAASHRRTLMSSNLSRRDFIRTSTVGASAAALGVSTARAYAANERVQIGWIGVGGRGGGLLTEIVASCPEARIVAVCDLIPERVERGQKIAERDKPKGYTNFREMFEKEKLDGVFTVVAPNDHASVAVPVLEAGYNTFAEKPMDITVENVDAVTRAARKSKGFYQIGTQRRYHDGYIAAMDLVHGGEIGKVTFLQGQWHWTWPRGERPIETDGGAFIEQASHHTDVMSWAMGNQAPINCVSIGYNQLGREPNIYGESHSATAFQFPNGVIFSYTHLFHLPPRFEAEKVWILCEKGGVDVVEGMLYQTGTREVPSGPERRIAEASGRDWGKGTREELCAFVECVKTGKKPAANVETGRICTLMCIMARKAMVNKDKNSYEPRRIAWKDLGSTTDPA
jgi:predicted dehydrogenase